MSNPVTKNKRHFEDLRVGEVVQLKATNISKKMIIEFATAFDPFPFHLDEEAANASLLGGLSASGWQTAALSLRMLVDAFISEIASMGGLGFSSLKWRKPVMVNDTISGTATITELRRSNSHPDWGIITLQFEIQNQNQQPVMSMTLSNLVEVHNPDTPIKNNGNGETP